MGSNNQIVRGGLGLADPIYRPRTGHILVYTAKTAARIHHLVGGKVLYLRRFLPDVAGYITAPNGVRCTPYRVLRGGKRVVFPEFPKQAWGEARISVPVDPRFGSVIPTHPILVEQGGNCYAVSAQKLPLLLEGRKLSLQTVQVHLSATTVDTKDRRLRVEASEQWRYELLEQVVRARFPFPRGLQCSADEILPRSEYVVPLRRKFSVLVHSVTQGRKGLLRRTTEDAKVYAAMSRLPDPQAVALADKPLKMSLVLTPSGEFFATAEFATDLPGLPGEPFVVKIALDGALAHRALVGSRPELKRIASVLQSRASETFTAEFHKLRPNDMWH